MTTITIPTWAAILLCVLLALNLGLNVVQIYYRYKLDRMEREEFLTLVKAEAGTE